jgi:hypothetical protein
LAASIAVALGRPAPASAAAGSNLIIGSQTNNSGTSDTQLIANSGVIAFKLLQQGQGTALMGHATATTGGTRGVYGRSDSPNGFGIQARNAGAQGIGAAIQAFGGNNIGVDARADHSASPALRAWHSGDGNAIYATTGVGGIAIEATSPSIAIEGSSVAGTGVYGATNSGYAVYGEAADGDGVLGESTSGAGVYGSALGGNVGVLGETVAGGIGVWGYSSSGYGVKGESPTNAGIFGTSSGGYSGYFTGSIWAQSANASVKNFRIDHPLDPANKVLVHSCVESNERKLVYDGLITTDAKGEATVVLPAYFQALNRDVRYQLTVIGSFAQAIVKHEVAGGSFVIATSEPSTRVSWLVTGVRQDAYAKAHPLEVESVKKGHEKGRYLTPLEHGHPASASVDAAMGATLKPVRRRAG